MEKGEFERWVTANFLVGRRWGEVQDWCFSQEIHKAATSKFVVHVHGYMKFVEKYQTTNPREFDVDGKHPNIKAVQAHKGWIWYVQKDGDYCGNVPPAGKDPAANFRRKRDDQMAFDREQEYKELKDLKFPVVLPWFSIPAPVPSVKKRHWWVKGPPDAGKSYTLGLAVGGMKVFACGLHADHRWEGYRNEDLVIYDDCIPSLGELLNVTQTFAWRATVPGKPRYTQVFWKVGHCRTVIVLSNIDPPVDKTGAFRARFNCYSIALSRMYEPEVEQGALDQWSLDQGMPILFD